LAPEWVFIFGIAAGQYGRNLRGRAVRLGP
jgi:hypothetical protein